jgi:hypothetical protein
MVRLRIDAAINRSEAQLESTTSFASVCSMSVSTRGLSINGFLRPRLQAVAFMANQSLLTDHLRPHFDRCASRCPIVHINPLTDANSQTNFDSKTADLYEEALCYSRRTSEQHSGVDLPLVTKGCHADSNSLFPFYPFHMISRNIPSYFDSILRKVTICQRYPMCFSHSQVQELLPEAKIIHHLDF